tara:strand:+ start:554 stop:1162 length:609 start_codon:yes stop_codon:yes gene_type:complete
MKKTNYIIRLIFLVCILFTTKSYADVSDIKNDLIVLGSNDAPVKIKIFSSLTCPHCANFHIHVVSEIKKNYIDIGKVQLIFIDFPLDQAAFNASKLVHCLDQKKQMEFLDIVYENQENWTSGSNIDEINDNLKKIVKNLGISSDQFDKCLENEVIADKILNGRIDAQKKYTINSTPAIVINEKKIEGSSSYNDIKKKIEKLI